MYSHVDSDHEVDVDVLAEEWSAELLSSEAAFY